MKGAERGYPSIIYAPSRITGNEKKPEKRILGQFGQDMNRLGVLDKLIKGGFQ